MKTIIITGASDGLGLEIAKKAISRGDKVINISRSACSLDSVINIKCDLTDEENILFAINEIKEKYSKFDVLINNAAMVGMEPLGELSYAKAAKTMKLNTIAPMLLISGLYDLIIENEADIINVGATISSKPGQKDQLSYVTSKWALRGTSANVSMELSKTKSRMIYINLGGMNTNMHQKDYGLVIENPSEWMNPSDVADIILYTTTVPKNIEISEITINRKNSRNK